jgi:D-alanyl-lipoteichoic acid acyltransferase DltB (MBOAT superfamily)
MLFSSPVFFVFFAIYYLLHRVTPLRFRPYLIIFGSTVFYAWWKIEFVWIPWLLMAIAFWGVQWMEQAAAPASRKSRAVLVITVIFLPLVFFKYTNFFYQDVIGSLFGIHGKLLDLPLPLGVSFVTFTLTAYIVDIYRREFKARHRPSTLLQYVLFFPHLIAGPILRPFELIPQLENPRPARRTQYSAAIALFTIGLAKKLIFADQIAEAVDGVYRSGSIPDAPHALLALYGFSVQIYCDFSGYTDMAIGLAMLLGVRLPNNFARPYGAASLIDFWRRWHITLSTWLRDYLYIPLGGSRGGKWKEFRNVMITMVLGGLWHGANWTFVIWGTMHGIGVSAVHFLRRLRWLAVPKWLAVVVTFHFVTVTWAFFRAPNATRALQILSGPFTGSWEATPALLTAQMFPILLVAIFFILCRFDDQRRFFWFARHTRREILWPAMIFLWILVITISQGSSAKFVYFDF